MHEFSGNRAETRPKPGERPRLGRFVAGVALALLAGSPGLAADHGAPAADHAAPPPASAVPESPPPPPPPAAVRPPPPKLDGPIAAAMPRPRLTWIIDPVTGRAFGGYDPVAYFLEGRPTMGDPDLQFDWQGATWLFQDEGTLAAFRDAPEVYAPRFGGRCAFAASQGRAVEGSPQLFLIHRGRLLFFADPTAKAAFLLDPDRLLAEAERRWPKILADLP